MASFAETGSSLPPKVAEATQQAGRAWDAFWQKRLPRERVAIAVAAVALVVLFVWLVLVQPALATIAEAPSRLDRLDRQLQQMQLAAGEAQSLKGTTPVPVTQATAALQAATERLGGKSKLLLQGDRATLQFTAAPADALRAWLGEARSGARARPVEAQWLKAGDGYTGSIVVLLANSQ